MRVRFAAALAVAGLISMSCGGITDPSNNTVDTFTGAFSPGSFDPSGHKFVAANGGELTVEITALAPIISSYVGLIWAQTSSDGNCNPLNMGPTLAQVNAQLNVPAISGAQIVSGTYCIFVYDAAGLPGTETYTVRVSHP
jgi:hypothetical protein